MDFDYGVVTPVSNRPSLTITYKMPHAQIDFAPELGDNYVLSAMQAGQTVNLPGSGEEQRLRLCLQRCRSPLHGQRGNRLVLQGWLSLV